MVTGALFEPKALCGSTSVRPAGACGGVGLAAALPDSAVFRGVAGEEETAGATFRSFDGRAGCAEGSDGGTVSTLGCAASAGEWLQPIWRPIAIKARMATTARIARRLTQPSNIEEKYLLTQSLPDYHRFSAAARGLPPELALQANRMP